MSFILRSIQIYHLNTSFQVQLIEVKLPDSQFSGFSLSHGVRKTPWVSPRLAGPSEHRSIGHQSPHSFTCIISGSHSFSPTWIWSTCFYLSWNKTPASEHLLLLLSPAQLLLLLLSPSPHLLPPANLHLLLLTPPLPEKHSSSLISSSPAPPPRNFLPPHLTPHPLLLNFTVSLPMQVKSSSLKNLLVCIIFSGEVPGFVPPSQQQLTLSAIDSSSPMDFLQTGDNVQTFVGLTVSPRKFRSFPVILTPRAESAKDLSCHCCPHQVIITLFHFFTFHQVIIILFHFFTFHF